GLPSQEDLGERPVTRLDPILEEDVVLELERDASGEAGPGRADVTLGRRDDAGTRCLGHRWTCHCDDERQTQKGERGRRGRPRGHVHLLPRWPTSSGSTASECGATQPNRRTQVKRNLRDVTRLPTAAPTQEVTGAPWLVRKVSSCSRLALESSRNWIPACPPATHMTRPSATIASGRPGSSKRSPTTSPLANGRGAPPARRPVRLRSLRDACTDTCKSGPVSMIVRGSSRAIRVARLC